MSLISEPLEIVAQTPFADTFTITSKFFPLGTTRSKFDGNYYDEDGDEMAEVFFNYDSVLRSRVKCSVGKMFILLPTKLFKAYLTGEHSLRAISSLKKSAVIIRPAHVLNVNPDKVFEVDQVELDLANQTLNHTLSIYEPTVAIVIIPRYAAGNRCVKLDGGGEICSQEASERCSVYLG